MEWETKINEYGMYSQYPKTKYTVGEWLKEIFEDIENPANSSITINGKYYKTRDLMLKISEIDPEAEIERTDGGYYGNKGIKTK